MPKPAPLFASEPTAAALLDMRPAEFRELVSAGALPQPVRFGRWDVTELQAIMRGTAARPKEEFDL
jgi:hypothetical protein